MATTTNYSWTTPDDTDLVKDGAAAIRTLGSSIDTTTKALNPSTTLGDIEYRSSTANTNTRLAIGSSGQNLTVVAGAPSWAASATSVLTTTGDVLYASAANTLARLGIGSSGQGLQVVAGVPSWSATSTSTLTTTGDILYASAANTLARRAIGSDGQVLTVSSGVPTWSAPAASAFAGCGLTNSGTQTVNNNTSTLMTYATENYDTDGFHSTVSQTARITIPSGKAGYYIFTAGADFPSNATGYRTIIILKNGGGTGLETRTPAINGAGTLICTTTAINAAVGDYFEVSVYQNSGSNLAVGSYAFTANYLGA
jgi:hypothetical protein